MKNMGSLGLLSYLLPDLWSLDCQKLRRFCKFLLMSEKGLKFKAVITIYVYASESSCFALLENGVGYYAMI